MKEITLASISKTIRERRSIFPASYSNEEIPDHFIREVLENANWAPNHKLTEPWRFKIFKGKGLQKLSTYLETWYKENTPESSFSQVKMQKMASNPLRSSCVIAICMQRNAASGLPEWEELAAVACAVQNMWLTCTELKIGSYWSSPRAIIEADEFLKLTENEKCIGLFYMGFHHETPMAGVRKSIDDKVEWILE